MKLLILTLLPFFSIAQASTYEPGDSTWIISSDTGKVKVYKGRAPAIDTLYVAGGRSTHRLKHRGSEDWPTDPYVVMGQPGYFLIHYDTIGPSWHQVSDTTAGYNPVMAMPLHEVRVYKNEWIETDPNILNGGTPSFMDHPKEQQLIPHHFAWLDINKKPFKLKVW